MVANKQVIQPVILKYHPSSDKDKREVVVFMPDMEANYGKIVCYAHMGQHSEASMEYFYECVPVHKAPASFQREGEDLVEEYRRICQQEGEELKLVKRDTGLYRQARWGWCSRAFSGTTQQGKGSD